MGTAGAAPNVLVWSDDPATDAVKEAGFEPVDFGPIAARLVNLRAQEREREISTLESVQTGLAEVKQAYLEQRFDDMVDQLVLLEKLALEVLARPDHTAALWEVEFQLGLAYLSRNLEGKALALEHFELALSLDAERRPLKNLYGPTVVTAFVEAVAARAAKTPRPIMLNGEPKDARVTVDGVAVVDPSRPLNLREGKHVVRASAPGYASSAWVYDVGGEEDVDEILFALRTAPNNDADATPDTVSGRAAINAIAAEAGAAVVLFVESDAATGVARVRVVTADDVSPVVGSVAEALELLTPEGTLRIGPKIDPLPPVTPTTPVYKKWWFWGAIGAVAMTAVAVGIAASNDEPGTIQIFAPGTKP